jgi:hypothetical protein
MHLIGLPLIDIHLIGLHLIGMHLIGLHLTGMHLIGLHLIGLHFMGLHLIGMHLIACHQIGVSEVRGGISTMRPPALATICVRENPSPKLLRAEIAFRSCVPDTSREIRQEKMPKVVGRELHLHAVF